MNVSEPSVGKNIQKIFGVEKSGCCWWKKANNTTPTQQITLCPTKHIKAADTKFPPYKQIGTKTEKTVRRI